MTNQRKRLLLLMMIAGGVLVILAGLSSALLYQPADVVTPTTVATEEQVRRITVEEAKAAFDAREAIFVDVRDGESFKRSHIPGALLIPVNELSDRLDELSRSAWIIIYCS